jgi:hypothetical protein
MAEASAAAANAQAMALQAGTAAIESVQQRERWMDEKEYNLSSREAALLLQGQQMEEKQSKV